MQMTAQEKRTILRAAVGLSIYLVLFYGWRGWQALEVRREQYQQLLSQAQGLKRELQSSENKALLAQKLKENFRLDPWKLSRASLVAEASGAIQRAAMTGGVQLGPMRESPGRPAAKELASVQLEGFGPAPAILGLLNRLETLGYPLVLEAVQINADANKPGVVKLNLTIIILDFEPWKKAEAPHA